MIVPACMWLCIELSLCVRIRQEPQPKRALMRTVVEKAHTGNVGLLIRLEQRHSASEGRTYEDLRTAFERMVVRQPSILKRV